MKETKRARWGEGGSEAVPLRKPYHSHSPIMAHHTPQELLMDLQWHLQEALTHLAAYRSTYGESPVDAALSEIQRHLRLANVYMAFGDLEEEVEANG